jgi:K+-sensing histidine kinase KdpD
MSMIGHAVEGAVGHVAEETGRRKAASDLFGEYGAGVTCASAVMLFLAIATIDKLTGTELRLQILYLIPVSIVTWAAGRAWGLVFSVAAVAAWAMMIGTAHAYSTKFYFYWEATVSLGTLVVFVLLLSRLRAALDALEEMHRGRDEEPDHAERDA